MVDILFGLGWFRRRSGVAPAPSGVPDQAIFSTSFNIMVSTVLQLRSPAEVRGRVMSLNATSNIGGSQAGGALSGAVATYLGAPETVAAGAAVLILTGLVLTVWRRWPFDPPEAKA